MNLFYRLFPQKEIKSVIGVLNEVDQSFDNPDFNMVRVAIEKQIWQHPDYLVTLIQGGTSPRKWVYLFIMGAAQSMLATGDYHLYRGVVHPMGVGSNLSKLFNSALDEAVKIGEVNQQEASIARQNLARDISEVG